jgi:hypothetical protein
VSKKRPTTKTAEDARASLADIEHMIRDTCGIHGVFYRKKVTTMTEPWHGPPHPLVTVERATLPVDVLSVGDAREIEATILETWAMDQDGGPR